MKIPLKSVAMSHLMDMHSEFRSKKFTKTGMFRAEYSI